MPAASVIPALIAYIKVFAVKKRIQRQLRKATESPTQKILPEQ